MEIVNDLDLRKQSEEWGVSIWQTPSFLFIAVGLIDVVAIGATYIVSRNYEDPSVLVLAESVVSIVIFLVGGLIIKGLEQMAKLNKIKNEFIAVASHQLRTPLSALNWEVELLETKFRKGLDRKQTRSIENMGLLTKRMNKMVNDLLHVVKIDQEKLVLKKERVDFIKIINEVGKNLTAPLRANDIKFKIKAPQQETMVLGDAEKIRLIVENLLNNSIKYSKKHGRIEITLKKSQAFWVFSIKDNGLGIPKTQHKQVFSKFFRSYNTSRYHAEGTGLGLYIVKNIVEKSGGRIWFKSEENVGSIFNFSLPMA